MGKAVVAEKNETAAKKLKKQEIRIVPPNLEQVHIRIEGTAPLLVRKFSDKAKESIEAKQQKLVSGRASKEARDPHREYEEAMIQDDKGRHCVRAIWFKRAMMAMTTYASGMSQKDVKCGVHVLGDLIPMVKHADVRMDSQPVKVGGMNKTVTMAYRPIFDQWTADLTLIVDKVILSVEEAVNLLAAAGMRNGVAENRVNSPKGTGNNGTFKIMWVKGGGE